MTLNRFLKSFAGALAVAALSFTLACNHKKGPEEPKEFRDIAEKIGEVDKLGQKAQAINQDQTQKLQEAGVTGIRPGETMQLTEEQKKALEERIKTEKNSSYQALLQEVLDKDKEIKTLNEQIAKIKAQLPKPEVARENDNHYTMALRYLRKRGVSETEAKRLISRVNVMEKLAPGFEIYHFYTNGVYGTWVSQGKARITPNDLIREEREKIEGERDTAVAHGEKLQDEVNDLLSQKAKITSEIEGLRTEKAKLIDDMNALSATNEQQKAKLNSLHYVVGSRKQLETDGVIIVPVFAKDRAGKNWTDSVFNKALDLRASDTLVIKASDVGLAKIGKVSVVPGSYVKDEHYSLVISEDKSTATIKFLTKDRFKNDKVVFAVTD
ncbi:MAG: hypothetical protein LWX11_11830 [Firmicutes bacterium]|nr:hypothetical protein [Bacillota bacterium]